MKKKGRGISTIGYSTGMYCGGDPDDAQIMLKPDGTFALLMGNIDMGQGGKTIFSQIAAEELGVPIETVVYVNTDTDIAPFQVGVFASRSTFISGNAVIKACQDLKEKLKNYTATLLKVEPDQLEVGDYGVFVKADPKKRMNMAQIAAAANYPSPTADVFLCGMGTYHPGGPRQVDPKTGEMSLMSAAAFATGIVEVEVDTQTGMVEVTKSTHVYDVGKAINPLMCQCQINGGATMGFGMALSEDVHPYWPAVDFAVETLGDYVVATAADIPADNQHALVEVPHPDGPYGAKGFSEMSANLQIPAVAAAVHDAIGVWITQFPITPEAVLKALESQKSKG